VVCVTSDTFTPEHGREALTLGNLVLGDVVVTAFRLANDELADL
jgi:hypothetical protein